MSGVSLSHRPVAFVAVGLLAVFTAGCESKVVTSLGFREGASSTVTVSVTFDDDAAAAFDDDLESLLVSTFELRAGVEPDVSRDRGLSVSATVPYEQVTAVSGLTGVAAAEVDVDAAGGALVTVTLVEPDELEAAVLDALADEPDADALAAAMLTLTEVGVAVTLPGGVGEVVTPPGAVSTPQMSPSGTTVTFTQPVATFVPGRFAVLGTLSSGRTTSPWWSQPMPLAAGAVSLLLVAASFAAGRRRR